MTLFITWVVFPALLVLLSAGCGLLLERLADVDLPGALLVPAGLATTIVLAQVPIAAGAPGLATPLVVLAGLAGLAIARPWRRGAPDPWMVAAVAAVFAVYAAPIVLSGEATFAGYVKLDDTSTWLALTDQVMERGLDLSGLAPSSFEATLDVNLADGYPFGVFLPLGIGGEVLGIDVAWLFQPYMATLALGLALTLWALAGEAVGHRWLRAGVAFVAAQPALLFGYYLWGGVKEVAAAMLLATAIALLGPVFAGRTDPRALIPPAVALAALVSVLTPAGLIWIAPALAIAAILLWRRLGRAAVEAAVSLAVAVAVLSLPILLTGELLPAVNDPLTGADVLGNLIEPLKLSQIAGVWPVGDFRVSPSDSALTAILVAAVVGAAALGLYALARRRSLLAALYVVGILVGTLGLFAAASPWNGGKALAAGSPVLLFAAGVGVAGLFGSGRRVEGGVLGAVILAGVLWSNALAYHEVRLAPRAQLAELEEIGERFAGQGPTLMTEYQPYGVRHFLREEEPEGASELRRRQIPLSDGRTLEKGEFADTDRLALEGLLVYRTLVLRRSPSQSRPPFPYALRWRGEYYEVWQRPPGSEGMPIEHLGLGEGLDPGAVPDCDEIVALAERAPPGAELAAAEAPPLRFFVLGEQPRPASWVADPGDPRLVTPDGPGELEVAVEVDRPGEYEVWLGGGIGGELTLLANGEEAGSVRHLQNNQGQYIPLGAAELRRGANSLVLRYREPALAPAGAGLGTPIGPLVLRRVGAVGPIVTVPPSRAAGLCGRRLDWVALVHG